MMAGHPAVEGKLLPSKRGKRDDDLLGARAAVVAVPDRAITQPFVPRGDDPAPAEQHVRAGQFHLVIAGATR